MKEKSFENKIKRYIKESVNGYRVKYFGCSYSEAGTPDILACVNGYFIAIEVKGDGGKPSELQLEKIKQIRNAGGFAYVVYPSAWDKLKTILDGFLTDTFNREEDITLK